jgi:DNA-binding NarL/FixJ family response regulator
LINASKANVLPFVRETRPSGQALVIAVIDHYSFSQECLVRALKSLDPDDIIAPFTAAQDCIAACRRNLDLIIYYLHGSDVSGATTRAHLAAVHQAYPAVPLIVLSDADDSQEPGIRLGILKSGADDFIPTRTGGIFTTIGALRFKKQGGTLLPDKSRARNEEPIVPCGKQHPRLTPRELTVLTHLQCGKANKIIAHELSMSENTVKIHVRNIMRKMGSSNRTQAVDKARTLWGGIEHGVIKNRPAPPLWCRRTGAPDRRVSVWHDPRRDAGR